MRKYFITQNDKAHLQEIAIEAHIKGHDLFMRAIKKAAS